MPQGRKKVPYSGKAKKQQLQEKRQRKVVPAYLAGQKEDRKESNADSRVLKINAQPSQSSKAKSSRYALQFFRETDEEIRRRKEEAYKPLSPLISDLEVCIETYFNVDVDFPKRPPWSYEMSLHALDHQEERYFTEYLSNLEKKSSSLGYFELNLETWRQLWRVLEMSDIILYIVDIRFPALMFPPTLYDYVTGKLKKHMILVFNKVDIAPPALVVAWKNYFKEKFPALHVVIFTSIPGYNLRSNPNKKSGLKVCRLKGRMKMAAEGAQKILDVCKEIVKNEVDLSSWQEKILEEMNEDTDNESVDVAEYINVKSGIEERYMEYTQFQNGVLTIGCVGHPNVGKSSLLNALMGKKVVSVSRTPGHTKHFQTIFLTQKVKLCDCPGLVFPSLTPKNVQVLMGSFPIAQLREPYSAIKFLAEHMDLIKLLALQHPDGDEEWSAVDVCNAWAKKRGYYTTRAARLDTYRAANHILRMTLEGKICFFLYPPDYSKKKDFWEKHDEIVTVKWIQAQSKFEESADGNKRIVHVSEEEEEEEEEEDSDSGNEEGEPGDGVGRIDKEDTEDSDEDSDENEIKTSSDNKFSILDPSS